MIIYGFYLIFPYLYTNLAHVDRETLSDDYYVAFQFAMLSATISGVAVAEQKPLVKLDTSRFPNNLAPWE